jgi:hypothetical protein
VTDRQTGPPKRKAGPTTEPAPRNNTECNRSTGLGVRGYREAAEHLLALGLTPAPNLPALRAMWTAGSETRRIAGIIAQRWGLAA